MTDEPDQAEARIAIAQRHVQDCEARVAKQATRVAELERDGPSAAVVVGQELLAVLEQTLDLAREHLRIEQDMLRHRGDTSQGGSK
jgi:hypothetical protein